MAKPNFHDRSWHEIDWETWGSQFSIVDRASSVGELQNGISTRYMEVQDLLSQLPPHAGRAHALLQSRAHVTPDDIKAIAMDVLRHRILLTSR